MSLQLHWFLPTSGDGRGVVRRRHQPTDPTGRSPTAHPTSSTSPRWPERLSSTGSPRVLTPTGTWCEDAWLTTAALIRETERLKFLVAFRPGSLSPTLAAQMAATYQRMSGGRLLLNVVTGGDADRAAAVRRLARRTTSATSAPTSSSRIVRGAWSGTRTTSRAGTTRVAGATVMAPPDPVPPLFFGGASDAAQRVAARHVDAYLTWGEPPADVAARLGQRPQARRRARAASCATASGCT